MCVLFLCQGQLYTLWNCFHAARSSSSCFLEQVDACRSRARTLKKSHFQFSWRSFATKDNNLKRGSKAVDPYEVMGITRLELVEHCLCWLLRFILCFLISHAERDFHRRLCEEPTKTWLRSFVRRLKEYYACLHQRLSRHNAIVQILTWLLSLKKEKILCMLNGNCRNIWSIPLIGEH